MRNPMPTGSKLNQNVADLIVPSIFSVETIKKTIVLSSLLSVNCVEKKKNCLVIFTLLYISLKSKELKIKIFKLMLFRIFKSPAITEEKLYLIPDLNFLENFVII